MSDPNQQLQVIEKQRGEVVRSYRDAYDAEAIHIIRSTKCPGATDEEFGALMRIAQMKNLNPLTGQIHFVPRWVWDRERDCEVKRWAVQVGIDGFRLQAARTREYNGSDKPVFEYEPNDKEHLRPTVAEVTVHRKGCEHSFVGVAHYSEFVQTYRDKKTKAVLPNKTWKTAPHVMLAKCAEAQALRKAFPEEMGDLMLPEEIETEERAEAREQPVERLDAPGVDASGAEARAKPEAKVDFAKMLAEARSQGGDALDAIAERIRKEVPDGPQRKVFGDLYKRLKNEVRAEYKERVEKAKGAESAAPAEGQKPEPKPKTETPPCEVCGLVGAHANDCPDRDDAGQEQPEEKAGE